MRPALMSRLALFTVTTITLAAPAFAATAYEAGLRQAHRRGVANAACYAGVFETYASLNRYRRWAVRRVRSRDNAFALEVYSKCRAAV